MVDADQAPGPMLPRGRFAAVAALLTVEYLLLSWRFDAAGLDAPGGLPLLRHAGDLALMAALAAIATLALRGPELRARMRASALDPRPGAHAWPALVLHALFFGALWWLTAQLFETTTETWRPWLAPWVLAALATPLATAPLLLPWQVWRALAPTLAGAGLVGGLIAALAWGLGKLTTLFWAATGSVTVLLSARLLDFVVQPVGDPEHFYVIGTERFVVELGPACSGFEGLGLMTVFLGAYVWVRRDELRPWRALALLPVALLVSWMANIVRITALILIGHGYAPSVAVGGFHSKAGWVFFCAIALGAIALYGRVPWFRRAGDARARDVPDERASAAAPYLLPAVALIATAMLTGLAATVLDPLWGVRVLAAGAGLWVYRTSYRDAWSRPTAWGPAVGLAVFLLWLLLVPHDTDRGADMSRELATMGSGPATVWLAVRALGSSTVVPLVEELAFRGYLLRRLIAADFAAVRAGQFSWFALIVSSVAFGAVHTHFVPAAVAGLGFALAYLRGAGLADAVLAHAVANVLIAGQVLWLDALYLW